MCVCKGSSPGSAVRGACICLCTRKIKRGHEYVCLSSSLSRRQDECMYMYANTAERVRLNKVVSLLLIMKYFV